MNNYIYNSFFCVTNKNQFESGLNDMLASVIPYGVYVGDNFISLNRNLSFLSDEKLMNAAERNLDLVTEKATLWRIHVLLWAMRNGLQLEGDFVECACYKGNSAKVLCDTVSLGKYPEKKYYLYDLFDHNETMPHHSLPSHSKELYDQVKKRFAEYPNVVVTQGKVPEILHDVAPQKIAFLHLDLNNAEAELGALEILFDRMVPGAILIFDDYGWQAYRAQKELEDPWLLERGYYVMELPTGQGMVIKR